MEKNLKEYDVEGIVVLMSAYNGARYLPTQLDSILSQDYQPVTLLVRDDGSPDGGETLRILRKYEQENPLRVMVLEGENLGFADSFSELVRSALERFPNVSRFAFADQDDVWMPEKLSRAIGMMKSCPDALPVAYCSNTLRVDGDLNPIGMSWDPRKVKLSKKRALVENFATGCTMVFNREAARIYDEFRPARVGMHDFLMYQICTFLGKLIWDQESFILYRQHTSNQIGRPGPWGRMKNRLKGRFLDHVLETQNRALLESYGHLMSEEDRAMLRSFVDYKKSIWSTCRLLFDRETGYCSAEQDFFYRLKVVMRTV